MALSQEWVQKIRQEKELLYSLGFDKGEVTTIVMVTGKEPNLTGMIEYLESGGYESMQDIRNKAEDLVLKAQSEKKVR